MKKLLTLFALVLILASSNSALALTPYQLAAAMLSSTNATCVDLTTDLSITDKGTKPEEVRKLQTFLYPKYLTEPATGYFGVLTEAAVKKLQAEYPNEIEKPTGYVGALTRGIIKYLTCGNSQTTTGAKSTKDTVASAPAYNPNGAWWLSPAATGAGSTGSSDPIKTTNTGNISLLPVPLHHLIVSSMKG